MRALTSDQPQLPTLRTKEHKILTKDPDWLDRVLLELCRRRDWQPIPTVELTGGCSLADAAQSFIEFGLKH
jgi:hypothetical protein